MKRSLVVAVAAVALLLAACTVPKPLPSTKPQPSPPTPAQGFDACAAPSTATMSTWWNASPFTSVGIYVGGANRACAQPNLTRAWATTVVGQGWKLLPIWVGPQAPCSPLSGTTKITADPQQSASQGVAQANAAADAADALGLKGFAPIYYDMEAYPRGGTCTYSVQNFTTGWVQGLHNRGYFGALYSSLCSGILDQAAVYSNSGFVHLDDVWIAAWNNTPNIFGFDSTCALSDSLWSNHQRVHQFKGGHDETWGGTTINIDSNAVDGATFPFVFH